MSEPQKKERLILVDGHSLVYRAFFALPSLTDREGHIVNAAYGFTSMLLLALQEHPDYVLASFDLGGRTFRHEELEQYKATRRPTPPDLAFRSLAARVPTTWRDGSTMSAPPIFAPLSREQGRLPLEPEPPRQPVQSTLTLESPPTEAVSIVREATELDRLVTAFAQAERAGFQVITVDDVPRRGRIAAIVVGLEERDIYYVPVVHEQERCLEVGDVLKRFAPALSSSKPSKLGFNQKADYLAL